MYEADELEANNFDADGNIKIGYVGAFPYAEVISGYTSFFLDAQSIVEEETDISISMEVTYTSSWFNESLEREGANNLINRGAALISQHADSMGLPLPARGPAFPTSPTTAAPRRPAPTPSSFPPTSTGSPISST